MTTVTAHKFYDNVEPMRDFIVDEYNTFLEEIKANSINTYDAYKRDINSFFEHVYMKESSFVRFSDLEKTTGSDIIKYRNKMRGEFKDSTINRRINSVRSLFKFLATDRPNIRTEIFNKTKRLKENDRNGYDSLILEEVNAMIGLANLKFGKEFSTLIELAFITAIRLDALLSLTIKENFYTKVEDGETINYIKTVDKSEEHIKPISDELMARLKELSVDDCKEIFYNYHKHKVGKHFKELVEELGLDSRRNIKFHSLKKASVNFVLEKTGDIKQAQAQGNHKSAVTSLNYYVQHNKKLSKMASYSLTTKVDLNPLENLTKEQLLEIIKQSSVSTKLELLKKEKDLTV